MDTYFTELMQEVKLARQEIADMSHRLSSLTVTSRADDLMDIDEACRFLGLKKPTVYLMTSRREIPFSKIKKKIYFSREALTSWLKNSERKTRR